MESASDCTDAQYIVLRPRVSRWLLDRLDQEDEHSGLVRIYPNEFNSIVPIFKINTTDPSPEDIPFRILNLWLILTVKYTTDATF